jgi:hypothetical protein
MHELGSKLNFREAAFVPQDQVDPSVTSRTGFVHIVDGSHQFTITPMNDARGDVFQGG